MKETFHSVGLLVKASFRGLCGLEIKRKVFEASGRYGSRFEVDCLSRFEGVWGYLPVLA